MAGFTLAEILEATGGHLLQRGYRNIAAVSVRIREAWKRARCLFLLRERILTDIDL